jgi:hypothetical protein
MQAGGALRKPGAEVGRVYGDKGFLDVDLDPWGTEVHLERKSTYQKNLNPFAGDTSEAKLEGEPSYGNWSCFQKWCNACFLGCLPITWTRCCFCLSLNYLDKKKFAKGMSSGLPNAWWLKNYFLEPNFVTSGTAFSLWVHLITWVTSLTLLGISTRHAIRDDDTIISFLGVCALYAQVFGVGLMLFAWIFMGTEGMLTSDIGYHPQRWPMLQAFILFCLLQSLLCSVMILVFYVVQHRASVTVVHTAAIEQSDYDLLAAAITLTAFGIAQYLCNSLFSIIHFTRLHQPWLSGTQSIEGVLRARKAKLLPRAKVGQAEPLAPGASDA